MTYVPSDETLRHFVWRKRYFDEDNRTPVFHYRMADHYFNSPSYIKPIRAFRGSGKSVSTCYVALHRAEKPDAFYTLIVSDTASQAESLVMDISDMVRGSSLPYRVVRDVRGEIELEWLGRRYFIVGKGAGASMRGIKRNRKRPDLIILDDIINDELVMNRMRVDRLNRWFYKALLPSLDPNGEVYAVGTPLSRNDLFMRLCESHPVLDVPIVSPSGVPAWPDRFSASWIEAKSEEYRAMGMGREWSQEYMLELVDSDSSVFEMDRVRIVPSDTEPPRMSGYVCALDGAFSEKEHADWSAFAVVGVTMDGSWWVWPYQLRGSVSDVMDTLFSLQSRFGFDSVGIEKGAFRLAVRPEMERRMADYQQWINVDELDVGGSKTSRMVALSPVVSSGRLTIVDTGEAAEALVEQMELTDMEACRASHDDLLDALSSVLRMDSLKYVTPVPDMDMPSSDTPMAGGSDPLGREPRQRGDEEDYERMMFGTE